ncbi:Flp family type IVb pilin [Paractinoplanes maris]|uniref:Flp family type IVb pilin n=1 Tax=Paractinoplanes maris TaxID=1734446 RepID=UPI002021CE55|nr:Flp family type IVb pilin [Actinoplanes maris]
MNFIAAYIQARLTRNDEGATAVEYGLLVSLIALVIIIGAAAFGDKLRDLFTAVEGKIHVPA